MLRLLAFVDVKGLVMQESMKGKLDYSLIMVPGLVFLKLGMVIAAPLFCIIIGLFLFTPYFDRYKEEVESFHVFFVGIHLLWLSSALFNYLTISEYYSSVILFFGILSTIPVWNKMKSIESS